MLEFGSCFHLHLANSESSFMPRPPLLPDRHKNRDFFVVDFFADTPLKDDIASMEHPMFSLSTKPDCRILEYELGDKQIVIRPLRVCFKTPDIMLSEG